MGDSFTELVRDGSLTGSWTWDAAGSRVEFDARHLWFVTVHGVFTGVTGAGVVHPDGAAEGTVTIDAASVDTSSRKRDQVLRSAQFFAVDRFPSITFTVERAVVGDGVNDGVEVTGTLTVAGRAQPVSFRAEVVDMGPQAVTLEARLTVDRAMFGMTRNPLNMAPTATAVHVRSRFVRAFA